MDSQEHELINFLSKVASEGGDGYDAARIIKTATGEDVDPAMLQELMQQGGQQAPDIQGQGDPAAMQAMMGGQDDPSQGDPSQDPSAQGQPQISPEEIEQIAQLVAQHLAQQGGGQPEQGLPKQSAELLYNCRTAPYIEGFLTKAAEINIPINEAVDFYGAEYAKLAQVQFDAANYTNTVQKVAAETDEKTLAYFDALAKQAQAQGYSYEDTLELLIEQGFNQ